MFYIVLGIIIMLILVAGYGTWMRRKTYKQIDKYESWKIDIMNRRITEEISRVKDLNVIGETEKKFERWRKNWDDIVTNEIPEIEEMLFSAEEAADKYRFGRAEQILKNIHEKLDQIESRIALMLKELHEVVDSEQKNREDIVKVNEAYHQVKKEMITKRSQLRDAAPYLDSAVKEISQDLKSYHEENENGNYIKAREILVQIKNQLDAILRYIAEIPILYKEIQINLPQQIKELYEGYHEMIEQGYVLRHLDIENLVKEMEEKLKEFEKGMKRAEFNEISEGVKTIQDQLEWLYQQLEREVFSRKHLQEAAPTLERDLVVVRNKISELDKETEAVQKSYQIDIDDLKVHHDIDHAYAKLEEEFKEVDEVLKEKKEAFSIILEKVEAMQEQASALRDSADDFKEKIKALRKDELVAKESVQNLKQKLQDCRRIVRKSNLPGVPQAYVTVLEEAQEVLAEVNKKLDKKPLEMMAVHQVLDDATDKVNDVYEKTNEMVRACQLAERLIQYGNRYRIRDVRIREELMKAEESFRDYNYQDAFEIALSAIKSYEPDVMKKIEEQK
ncbi:septation ring formation regulator [Scopulibacillus daqui]|uniref:Septation ring formation regulator EzrA n=1 Tax=Scopulibacillus daqui TaxID=1469162 RepID=A0ABS2PY00_9BACL|nr:septation ring formation regulator EzrA [Scopulibacillus daqui]MBM7644828.1 septation ring formation regulator [Scopulibacillus daqui]